MSEYEQKKVNTCNLPKTVKTDEKRKKKKKRNFTTFLIKEKKTKKATFKMDFIRLRRTNLK